MSGYMVPMSPRGPRPHSPALLGKALRPLPIYSQAVRHTPREGMGIKVPLELGGTMALPPVHPPRHNLTSWKLMQRPSGQEYSGQGTLVPLGLPGAVTPSEGKRRESRQGVRTAPHASPPTSLGLPQGNNVLPQPSSSLPWEQSEIPSQSCSGFRHSCRAEPHQKRPLHGGSWVEPAGTRKASCCALSLQRGWQGEPKALNLNLAQRHLWEGSGRGGQTWGGVEPWAAVPSSQGQVVGAGRVDLQGHKGTPRSGGVEQEG